MINAIEDRNILAPIGVIGVQIEELGATHKITGCPKIFTGTISAILLAFGRKTHGVPRRTSLQPAVVKFFYFGTQHFGPPRVYVWWVLGWFV